MYRLSKSRSPTYSMTMQVCAYPTDSLKGDSFEGGGGGGGDSSTIAIAVVASVAVFMLLLACVAICCIKRCRQKQRDRGKAELVDEYTGSSHKATHMNSTPSLHSQPVVLFSILYDMFFRETLILRISSYKKMEVK